MSTWRPIANLSMTCGVGKKSQSATKRPDFRPWETDISEKQKIQYQDPKGRNKNVCIFLNLHKFCLKYQSEVIQWAQ